MTTNWSGRTIPTTSWGARTDVNYLMTQALDFLMTQDDNYIVLQDSYAINTSWNTRNIISTSWTGRPTI